MAEKICFIFWKSQNTDEPLIDSNPYWLGGVNPSVMECLTGLDVSCLEQGIDGIFGPAITNDQRNERTCLCNCRARPDFWNMAK